MNAVVLTEDDVPGAKLLEPPEDCSVLQLKRWLECRGLPKSQKKKELIDLVKKALASDLDLPIDVKIDGGKWYEAKSKTSPISDNGNHYGENTSESLKWSVFPSVNIPELFDNGHLCHCLVEQPSQVVLNDDETYIDGDDTAKPLTKGKALYSAVATSITLEMLKISSHTIFGRSFTTQ